MAKSKKPTQRKLAARKATLTPAMSADRLLGDIRSLIESAREQTARAVNSALVGLYWHIGKRIREDVLLEKRAGYGEQIVYALSRQLTEEYGRGFTRANLLGSIWSARMSSLGRSMKCCHKHRPAGISRVSLFRLTPTQLNAPTRMVAMKSMRRQNQRELTMPPHRNRHRRGSAICRRRSGSACSFPKPRRNSRSPCVGVITNAARPPTATGQVKNGTPAAARRDDAGRPTGHESATARV